MNASIEIQARGTGPGRGRGARWLRAATLLAVAAAIAGYVVFRLVAVPPQAADLVELVPGPAVVSDLARASGLEGEVERISPGYPVKYLRLDFVPYAAGSFGVPKSYRGSGGLQHVDVLVYRFPTERDAREVFTSSPPELAHRDSANNLDDRDATAEDVARWRVGLPEGSVIPGMEARAICLSGSLFERSTCSGFYGWFLCDDVVFEISVATWPGTPIDSPEVADFLVRPGNHICEDAKAQASS